MGKKASMLQKALAGILGAAVFAGSVFTGTVFAEGPSDPASSVQITNPGGQNENSVDHVTTEKTVTGTGNENEFNVTLTVTTQEELKEVPVSADTAVVLVMDTSGSMAEKVSGKKSSTRIRAAEEAAKNFVDKYVSGANSGDKRYAALVRFSDDAVTVAGWNNLNSGSNLQTFKNEISFNANGGTNIEGGLQLAYNLIQSGKGGLLKDCTNINVVLLSDGCPTYHVEESTRSSIAKVEGVRGGGTNAELEDWQQAEAVASTIRDSGISLYSIAFATGTESFELASPQFVEDSWHGDWYKIDGEWKHGYWVSWESRSVYDWMNGFSDKAFSAQDADKLTLKFENILHLITLGAKAWKVTDPMGTNILYNGEVSDTEENDTNKFAYKNGILTWDLKNSTPQVSGSNPKTYTYTLTYPITLNTAADGFVSGQAYPTNGETVLTYYLFSKVNDDTTIPEEPNKMNFEIPEVKGYLGELSFIKNGVDGVLSGANFNLSMNDGSWEKEAASSVDGTVTISGIPSGFAYTLTEDKMAGYEDLAPISVKVSYGSVTDADNKVITHINNIPVTTPDIIVVHDYGEDGSFNEDPIDFVENFQPTPQHIYNGERYILTAADDPYENANGDYVYVLHYAKYVEDKSIIVVHDYGEDGYFSEDPVSYREDFQAVPQTSYNGESYTLTAEDAPYQNGNGDYVIVLHYSRESIEIPVDPPATVDTMIVINKSWTGGEAYDGNITFTATDDATGRSYTGTLRTGRSAAYIIVPSGGTFTISEDVPSGYTASYPDGSTVTVATGTTTSVSVVNTVEEEVIDEPETPLAPPVGPGETGEEEITDEETPLVNPPQTGSVASGISVLFGFAAAAIVSSAVLRKKK